MPHGASLPSTELTCKAELPSISSGGKRSRHGSDTDSLGIEQQHSWTSYLWRQDKGHSAALARKAQTAVPHSPCIEQQNVESHPHRGQGCGGDGVEEPQVRLAANSHPSDLTKCSALTCTSAGSVAKADCSWWRCTVRGEGSSLVESQANMDLPAGKASYYLRPNALPKIMAFIPSIFGRGRFQPHPATKWC